QTTEVKFFPDGEKFAAIRYDGLACIIDTPTGDIQVVFNPSPGDRAPRATQISLSRGGELLSVATPGSITVWDIPSATIANRFDAPETMQGIIAGMKLSGNGQVVAYTESRAVIHVWNTVTNEHRSLLGAESDKKRYMGCWPVEVSFDGRYVAVGSPESRIGIYSTGTGQLVETLSGHKGPVSGIMWSADGSRLLSGSWDKSVKLWDVSPLQDLDALDESSPPVPITETRTFSGALSRRGSICRTTFSAEAPVEWIAMSHDESWYISCSADGDVDFWDPRSGVSELKVKLQGLSNN
ncbi:U3 snoRNP protein, partial [Tulasnella sp. 427]